MKICIKKIAEHARVTDAKTVLRSGIQSERILTAVDPGTEILKGCIRTENRSGNFFPFFQQITETDPVLHIIDGGADQQTRILFAACKMSVQTVTPAVERSPLCKIAS